MAKLYVATDEGEVILMEENVELFNLHKPMARSWGLMYETKENQ